MIRGRAKPVQPASPVFVTRRGEGGARKLLCVEAERRSLRAVSPLGKRPLDRLAFEMAAKAAHVAEIGTLHGAALELGGHKFKRAQPLLELRPSRAGLAYRAIPFLSVDVDVDLVGNLHFGLASETKLITEQE